jgi:hypothetical protein
VLIGALFSYAPAEKSVIVFLSRAAASPSPHWQIRRGQSCNPCLIGHCLPRHRIRYAPGSAFET